MTPADPIIANLARLGDTGAEIPFYDVSFRASVMAMGQSARWVP